MPTISQEPPLELDHIFILIDPDSPEPDHLRAAGLIETYRRKHPGQGTENICFCFDNIFLECLWVTNIAEVTSSKINRTGLHERSQWQTRATSPFGLAWRDAPGEPCTAFPTWSYAPPYLPAGVTIDVAVDSDDPRQPMMFRSPGAAPPTLWPASRRGALQQQAGLARVLSVTLHWPEHAPPTPALAALAAATILDLAPTTAPLSSISLSIEQPGRQTPLRLTLPAAATGR